MRIRRRCHLTDAHWRSFRRVAAVLPTSGSSTFAAANTRISPTLPAAISVQAGSPDGKWIAFSSDRDTKPARPCCNSLQTRSVGMHPVNIGRAAPLRCKDDPLSVRRKRRVVIEPRSGQQRTFVIAIGVRQIQRAAGGSEPGKNDARPLGRQDRGRCGHHQRSGQQRACRRTFQRDVSPELRLAGFIHFAHPASAEGGEDFVGPRWRAEAA